MRKGINISHVNIENMGGRDQSQVKIKFKKFEKSKSVPKDVPKSHNDDINVPIASTERPKLWLAGDMRLFPGQSGDPGGL